MEDTKTDPLLYSLSVAVVAVYNEDWPVQASLRSSPRQGFLSPAERTAHAADRTKHQQFTYYNNIPPQSYKFLYMKIMRFASASLSLISIRHKEMSRDTTTTSNKTVRHKHNSCRGCKLHESRLLVSFMTKRGNLRFLSNHIISDNSNTLQQ